MSYRFAGPIVGLRDFRSAWLTGLLSVLSVLLLAARFLAPAPILEPDHEHLMFGGTSNAANLALQWHQHSSGMAHSHPITGNALHLAGRQIPQVISFDSHAVAQLASYLGWTVNEILAPHGGIDGISTALLLPLGLAALGLATLPGLAPPAPPPKPRAA